MESNPINGLDHSDGSESNTNLDGLPGSTGEIEENCKYLKLFALKAVQFSSVQFFFCLFVCLFGR